MRQQSLHLTLVEQAMLKIEPNAIESKMSRVMNVGGDEMSEDAHADRFACPKFRQCFALSHRSALYRSWHVRQRLPQSVASHSCQA